MFKKTIKFNLSLEYWLAILFIISIFIPMSFNLFVFNIEPSQLCLFFLVIIFFSKRLSETKLRLNKRNKHIYISYLFLLFIFIVSTIMSNNILISFKGLVKWTFGFLVLLIIPTIFGKKGWKRCYKTFLITGNLIMSFVVIFVLIKGDINQSGLDFIGFSSNQWGQFSVVFLILNFTNVLTKRRPTNFYFLLVSVVNLILSFSKASWGAGILSLTIIIFIFIKRKKELSKKMVYIVLLLIFVSLLLIGSYYVFIEFLPTRLSTIKYIIKNPLEYRTMEIRYTLWEKSYNLSKENLWGVGLYNLKFHLDYTHAHNILFEILGSAGIIGLLSFLLFIVLLFSRIIIITFSDYNFFYYKLGLLFASIAYFIANNFSDSFGPRTHWLFWITTSLILSIENNLIREK